MRAVMKVLTGLAMGLLVMALAPPAHAMAVLQLVNSGCTITVYDNSATTSHSAGCTNFAQLVNGDQDVGAQLGVITWNGTFNNFTVSVSTGITKPAQGSPSTPSFHMNTVDTYTAGALAIPATTLTVTFSEDTYTCGPKCGFALTGSISATGGETGTYAAYYNDSPNQTYPPAPLGTLIASAPYAGSTIFPPPPVTGVGPNSLGPYALTQELTITFAALGAHTGTTFSSDLTLDGQVPEPATVSLLGGVMLLTFGALRRKLRRS